MQADDSIVPARLLFRELAELAGDDGPRHRRALRWVDRIGEVIQARRWWWRAVRIDPCGRLHILQTLGEAANHTATAAPAAPSPHAGPATWRDDRRIESRHPVQPRLWSCIVFECADGDGPKFTDAEVQLVDVALSRINWLHQGLIAHARWRQRRGLPPRLRATLELMLKGHTRHEIAKQLNLSSFTVRDYMSQVYRKFNVRSQLELIHRFRTSDEHPE